MAELRQVRRDGYAITDGELAEEGRAIAAPVVHGDRVVGAVAVSGPSFRLPLARLQRLAPQVQRAARELQALWPYEVTARDFGLGVRPPDGNGRARPARRHA
jgi:DNA-binding IclR family transcriptional regulator